MKIQTKMEADLGSSVGYGAVRSGDALLLIINLGRLVNQPLWVREFVANELLRRILTSPKGVRLAEVIDLEEVRAGLRHTGTF